MFENVTDITKTRAEIDLGAVLHNYKHTKELVNRRIICVVKADAYGHGAVAISKKLEEVGADFFAVANIDEALELRRGGIKGGIVILGYVFPDFVNAAVENDVSLALASLDAAKTFVRRASGRELKVHIKLNTGMNRTGFNVSHGIIPDDLKETVEILKQNPNIRVEGLFSHFAAAENNPDFSNKQFECYTMGEKYLKENGITPEIRHICNSAGLLEYPHMFLDAVRLGITLYGCSSVADGYLPVMQFKTRVIDIHALKKGDLVGYGLTYTAQKDMKMAVICAGYADGLRRGFSCGKGEVLCHGKRVPIIGRVCMDMAMIDVTDIPDVKIGDDVVIWGNDGDRYISCDEQAQKIDTISYELLCGVAKRVPRIYING